MAKKHSREKQAQVLRRTQAKRKEQKKKQVLKAIQEIQTQKKPLTFKNIATVAGCSISYLYKWDEIKAYIHELQQQKQTTLNPIEENSQHQPHSLKTLHEVSKQRIRDLEATIKELKHQNEKLRGHVAEIYELRHENERLRIQLRELMSPASSSKVIPIQASTKKNASPPSSGVTDPLDSIIESIKDMGIKVGNKLKQEITNRESEQLISSIEAFKQYRDSHEVKSQEACLLSMIREEAEPNTESTSKVATKPRAKVVSAADKHQKELISPDKLKKLSKIFNRQND